MSNLINQLHELTAERDNKSAEVLTIQKQLADEVNKRKLAELAIREAKLEYDEVKGKKL